MAAGADFLLPGAARTILQAAHISPVLPAMGYSEAQIKDLTANINNTPCDLVLFSTPIDLCRLLSCNKPTLRVRYDYADHGEPRLEEVLKKRMASSSRF